MNNKLSKLSKVFLFIAAIMLFISIVTPIWRIELSAPQYPEGLVLKIFSNKLGGNVDIINGLNHYIGMHTLHEADFIEFTVLPYIIGFFALISITVMLIGKKKGLYILFSMFVLFGIVAMVDFWRWEYDYGHNLDPNAAIIVPGMAYQPPLIGYKQLLNFGAYSVPDIGGWLFIGSGILMLLAVVMEIKQSKKNLISSSKPIIGIIAFILLSSCSQVQQEPIHINKEHCDNCKMMITDPRFAAELVTTKGRIYKFDDIICMQRFMEGKTQEYHSILISSYLPPHDLFKTDSMFFIKGANIKSPMQGNIAAFVDKAAADKYSVELGAEHTKWEGPLK